MTQLPLHSSDDASASQLDGSASPAGSSALNDDSTSLNGLEVGEAHDDEGESDSVTANLLREASAALRADDRH